MNGAVEVIGAVGALVTGALIGLMMPLPGKKKTARPVPVPVPVEKEPRRPRRKDEGR